MKKRGLLRLSTAISAVAMVGGVYWASVGGGGLFGELEDFRTYMCVNAPNASPQDLKKCAAQLGVGRSLPRSEHLTLETYWAEALGFALLMDVVLAAFVFGIAWLSGWVARGFNADALDLAPESTSVCSASIPSDLDSARGGRSRGALFHGEQALATSRAASALVLSGAPGAGQ